MTFLEIQFPTDISYGSRGGPGWHTRIFEGDGGHEERYQQWEYMRHTFDVAYGVKTYTQLGVLRSFFNVVNGATKGFRYKDWLDFTTASDGRSAPTNLDSNLGVGNGTTTTFQLKKTYSYGAASVDRVLQKPVANTTVVAINGVNQASGWSIDTTSGILTFSTAPSAGQTITIGCEFDVPCRFDDSLDKLLGISVESFDQGGLDSIGITEIKSLLQVPESFNPGSGSTQTFGAELSINYAMGRCIALVPTANNLVVRIPSSVDYAPGGPHWYVRNTHGTYSITLKTGTTSLGTLAPGHSAMILLLEQAAGSLAWEAWDTL